VPLSSKLLLVPLSYVPLLEPGVSSGVGSYLKDGIMTYFLKSSLNSSISWSSIYAISMAT